MPVGIKRDQKKEVAHNLETARANPTPSPQKDADAHSSPDSDDNKVEKNKASQPHANHPALGGVYAFHLNDEHRRWIKDHRTPIATSIASVSSTLVAVCNSPCLFLLHQKYS